MLVNDHASTTIVFERKESEPGLLMNCVNEISVVGSNELAWLD